MSAMWPRYQAGHQESLHALGVVSVNFANFERAVTWVFAAVAKKSEDDARAIHSATALPPVRRRSKRLRAPGHGQELQMIVCATS